MRELRQCKGVERGWGGARSEHAALAPRPSRALSGGASGRNRCRSSAGAAPAKETRRRGSPARLQARAGRCRPGPRPCARAASAAAASDPPGARPAKPDQTAGSKRRRAASAAPAGAPKRPKRTGAAGGSDPEAAAEAAARKAEAAAQKQKQKQEAKELKRAAAKEQRQLAEQAAQAQKAAEKAAEKAEEAQARRRAPSAARETATAESTYELLSTAAQEFVDGDTDAVEVAARRALLGPLLADGPPPAAELLALCERWRAQLHTAYGNATELPVSQHAEANLTLRLEGMGPERRRELSTAWLALPGVVAGETGARARCKSNHNLSLKI